MLKNDFNGEEETKNELEQVRETVALLTSQCRQLEEANRAWQQYEEMQVDSFRRKIENYLSIDENASFEEISQQTIEQIRRERENFAEQYQMLEKEKEDVRSEYAKNLETMQQAHMNRINQLNEELSSVKDQYDKLNVEKEFLSNELEKRCEHFKEDHVKSTIGLF